MNKTESPNKSFTEIKQYIDSLKEPVHPRSRLTQSKQRVRRRIRQVKDMLPL